MTTTVETHDRSNFLTAMITDDQSVRSFFAAYWEDGNLRIGVRSAPTAPGDSPRWLWQTITKSELEKSVWAKGVVKSTLRRKVKTDGDLVISGVWTVDLTERDHEGLNESPRPTGAKTKSLTERLHRTYDTPAPRTFTVDGIDGLADWLMASDGPMEALRVGNIQQFTENPLTKTTGEIITLDLEERGGIKLADGSVHVPFEIRPGMTNIDFLLTAHKNKIPVVFFGEPGTGKSQSFHAAFERFGLFSETCGSDTQYSDLVGGFLPDGKGGFIWVDRELILSLKARGGKGAPYFLDEITMAEPTMLTSVLYDLLTMGYLKLPGNPNHPWLEPIIPPNYSEEEHGPIEDLPKGIFAGPEWYFCAAGNPDVVGAQMSDALLSRLTLKPTYVTNYDAASDILGPEFDEVITVARNMEAKRINGEVMWAPQMRNLVDFATVSRTFSIELALANLLAECRLDQDREILEDVIARTMGVSNIQPFRI